MDMINSHGELTLQCIRWVKQGWKLEIPVEGHLFFAIVLFRWRNHLADVIRLKAADVVATTDSNASN